VLGFDIVVSESREAMDAEVEAMYRHSKEIVESESYHKKVMEECAKMRAVLNPQIAKDRQQEEDINNLKSEVSGMKGTLTDIKSMLSVALEKVNTKK
jgi:tRNA C32,U32 (ribose-2'-O)-methylase TrmJ